MHIDITFGMFVYVVVSMFFGEPFSYTWLLWTLFSSILPDGDFVPYLILRKRMRWVSHHLVHYPLFFIAITGALMLWNTYAASLFGLAILVHFIHDTYTTKRGIRWLWPFTRTGWCYYDKKWHSVTWRKRHSMYQESLNTIPREKSTIRWEIMSRVESFNTKNIILLLCAICSVVLFM